jgi:adenylyltransferase/sulfurtransferase
MEYAELQEQVDTLQRENDRLRAYLASIGTAMDETHDGQSNNSPGWDGVGHGLTKHQVSRYSRQIVLPSFGVSAQSRLCSGSVLIVGAGGLGSPVALYLAAAGVGRIGLVDRDNVDLSNIHRQILHTEANVGVHKVDSAACAILALNSSVAIDKHKDGFTPLNAVHLVRQYDVVVDASDNPSTRYLINDACVIAQKPLVSGAALGTDGQITVYCAGGECPCYRCLFPTAPPPQNCARCVDAGVLGVLPGIIGTIQALETIKLLSKVGEPMARKLLVVDGLSARYHSVLLRPRSPHCVACGDKPQIREDSIQTYD